MTVRVKMGRGVLARRLVAAAYVTASHAKTKVHPTHPQLEALLTALRRVRLDGANRVKMAALWHCSYPALNEFETQCSRRTIRAAGPRSPATGHR